jgi:hypothetical protein
MSTVPSPIVGHHERAEAHFTRFGNRLVLVAIAALLVGAALAGAAGTVMRSCPATQQQGQLSSIIFGSLFTGTGLFVACVGGRLRHTSEQERKKTKAIGLSFAAVGAALLLYSGLLAALRAGNPSPPMLATGIGLGAVGGLFLGLGLYAKLTDPTAAQGNSTQEAS